MSTSTPPTKLVSELCNEKLSEKDDTKNYELIKRLVIIRQELKYKKNRLNENMFAGVCFKSTQAQRKQIFVLELQQHNIEYKLKNNLI